jgi:heme/copper-type cytochrome/quinol oxidase subunit 2
MKRWCQVLVTGLVAAGALVGSAGPRAEDEPQGPPVKEIKMYAENWKWTPDVIRVEQGTQVVIVIDNVDASHRFDLKEYKLKVALPQDKTTTIEFIADKPGEFRWRCGRPCGDGCPKMVGTLVVSAPGTVEE